MQKVFKFWLAVGLALGTFVACSDDRSEPNGSAQSGGESVSFSLNAEVSVDDPSLRAIDYKLGNNANGELVPMPQFVDKQVVLVHTILKSSDGTVAASTLRWRYDATKRKLVLRQDDGHNIPVVGFNNDSDVKWYVSGMIGGYLSGTRVYIRPERVLKGVDGNVGDVVGRLDVPYAFGWTELKINTNGARDGNGSHKYAEVPKETSIKFVPRGALIAYKLGNALSSGSYSFSPKGFVVTSNTWGDDGSFDLNTEIPESAPQATIPRWMKNTSCGSSIYYTFADGHAPSAIAHNGISDKIYYAWVMPDETQPTIAEVRVMLKGESSRPETTTYKDYTKTYFTDYAPKTTGAQGKVSQGKVHKLTANATHRVALPIEYVTEYNLAGGEGLTYTVAPGVNYGLLNGPALGGEQPAGVTGPLRFSLSHSNDQSGYYNLYKVNGDYHAEHNVNRANLSTATLIDTDGSSITLGDKYVVPTRRHWRAVFPGGITWANSSAQLGALEQVRVGLGSDELNIAFYSDYSGTTHPNGGGNATDNAVVYAIRFKSIDRRFGCTSIVRPSEDYDAATNTYKAVTYLTARDDAFKCAYRFTRVGGVNDWEASYINNMNMTNRFIIDVVYLGEETTPTELATISDEAWWATKKAEGKVFSRTFPAAGNISPRSTYPSGTGFLDTRGYWAEAWSSSYSHRDNGLGVSIGQRSAYAASVREAKKGYPVRLFSQPVQ